MVGCTGGTTDAPLYATNWLITEGLKYNELKFISDFSKE